MSLLEWKKLAKQKTELGNKINFVHDTILKNQLGEKASQESLQKVFKPITTSSIGDGGSGPCCAKNPTQKNVPKTPPRKKPV